ncbi:hypothetical protein [Massilia sp. METH4]|uniref:hypothetical protein n=1 Tax=Massilia sp. METH4 TaxID=3123041 RepID=UPI0030CB4F7B
MNNRFLKTVTDLGWFDAVLYGVARICRNSPLRLHRYYFVAQRVASTPSRAGWGRAIRVRAVSVLADIPWGYPRPRDVLAERFRQGGHSLAAWRGDELAGFLWYQFGAYREDEVRVRYCLASPHSAWDYDVFVQPHLRLGPTFAKLWEEAHFRLHARGVRWTCSRISAFNPDSLRSHARLGAVRLGSATSVTLGRWQCMFATQAPYFHVSFSAGSIPQLRFDTDALEHAPRQESLCHPGRP